MKQKEQVRLMALNEVVEKGWTAQKRMLVQVDGSTHRWLGESLPKLCLIAAVDDATGKVLGALFREEEDTAGYFVAPHPYRYSPSARTYSYTMGDSM